VFRGLSGCAQVQDSPKWSRAGRECTKYSGRKNNIGQILCEQVDVSGAVLANLQKMAPARRFSPSGPRFTPTPSAYESVNLLVITAGLAIEPAAHGTEQAPHGERSGSRTSLLTPSISKEGEHRGHP
jgi:hypothetical protein